MSTEISDSNCDVAVEFTAGSTPALEAYAQGFRVPTGTPEDEVRRMFWDQAPGTVLIAHLEGAVLRAPWFTSTAPEAQEEAGHA